MIVTKYDGREEPYQLQKIQVAMNSAFIACNENITTQELKLLCEKVEQKLLKLSKGILTVKEIHNVVENTLMNSKYKYVARKYIEYRHERDISREGNGKLIKDIEQFLDRTSEEFTNENSNKDSLAVSSHRDLIAGIVSKHYATTQILPKHVRDAHLDGFIWVHDCDYMISPLTNCAVCNYPDMLENGFKVGDAEIESPKSIGVAATILSQIAAACASGMYGGNTLSHLDTHLSKYVQKSYDKLQEKVTKGILTKDYLMEELEKEVHDAMQTLVYQINSLTTTNGQAPFITISFGLDTTMFGRMITRNYLKVHMGGIGKNKITPVFPKVIFFLQDGINLKESDPNYDLKKLAIDCAVERIYPDFISLPINKQITGATNSATTPMSCRSFLSKYEENDKEKIFGRFNLGVVTLNLPMIAQLSVTTGKDFYKLLDEYCEIAYDAHMVRVNRLKGTKARQNPIMFMYGAIARLKADETIDQLFYNGRSSISIGYIGAAEMSEILVSKQDKDKIKDVLQKIHDKCDEFYKRSNIAFSLYGTPSEGYCLKSATAFKKMFGEGVIERDYLTNSFHLPVWVSTDPYHKFLYEKDFAKISNGGNISYVEQPNLKNNKKAYEDLLDFAYKHVHYFGINMPVDKCFKCGFSGEFLCTSKGFRCPQCDNRDEDSINVIRRVSGYLTAPNSRPFNKGKQQEVSERVKHTNKG